MYILVKYAKNTHLYPQYFIICDEICIIVFKLPHEDVLGRFLLYVCLISSFYSLVNRVWAPFSPLFTSGLVGATKYPHTKSNL